MNNKAVSSLHRSIAALVAKLQENTKLIHSRSWADKPKEKRRTKLVGHSSTGVAVSQPTELCPSKVHHFGRYLLKSGKAYGG